MSTGMPELGSKISLISKADIRYEGRLFTVDPAECTIALANVRSYGTEDRETQFPISPQNQVYDYILFRGSDIKDIRVVNNVQIPNDPAIMQMQLPAQQMVNQQPFQPQQFPVPVMGHMGAQMASVLDLIGGGSRSTTPISLHSRKSPTTDMGVQVNKSGINSNKDGSRRNNNQNRGQRDRRDSGNQNQMMMMGHDTNHRNQQQNRNNNNHQQYHGNNQNRGWNNHRGNQQQQQQGGGGMGMTNGGGNMRGQRPRGRGPPLQQGFRQNIHNQNGKGGRGGKTTIKFDSDYDFEQANSKFEELRLGLAKVKVGEEANKPEQLNGGETDKKDDSGNETGAGEHEQEEDEVTVGYDKTKSFFDNISCEAAQDRTSGKNRSDWRHERKINSETFGASARRGGFYSFRGRGGYYNNRNNMNNMGGGSGGSGGNSGGYRSGGYHRGGGGNFRGGRNFNNRNYSHHQSSGTGIPQQPNNFNNKQEPQQSSEVSETSTATAQQQNSATTPSSTTKSTVVTSSPAAGSATTPAPASALPASLQAPIAAGN